MTDNTFLLSCPLARQRSGFTLVELSIVIVIIGLIVGGIVGGQALSESAKLNRVVADVQKLRAALYTFNDKYGSLPGDLPNAYSYWPSAGCTNDDVNSVSTGCNGDGNGQVVSATWLSNIEPARAWQHMALSGILGGSYAGVRSDDAPPSPFPKSVYMLRTYINGGSNYNSLYLGTKNPSGYNNIATLTPSQGKAIDAKSDDGVASMGNVIGVTGANPDGVGWSPDCMVGGALWPGANSPRIEYDVGKSTVACRMVFYLD